MSFSYDLPTDPGRLRQGELLGDVYWYLPDLPLTQVEEGTQSAPMLPHHEPRLIVLNNDCDLQWDFNARFPDDASRAEYAQAEDTERTHPLLLFVLTCSLYEQAQIRSTEGRNLTADLWRRVRNNQDRRYHRIAPSSAVDDSSGILLPELFLDFKKTIPLPTKYLYQGIAAGAINRLGVLPPPYIHDLVHRYYSFQSRVAVPDL